MLASAPGSVLGRCACSRLARAGPAAARRLVGCAHSASGQTVDRATERSAGSEATTSSSQPHEPSVLEELIRGGSRVTRAAHLFWQHFVRAGDFVVDATCGNGGDTLWLSRAVGPSGRVLAFDIQADAIQSTRDLLEWELPAEAWPRSLDLVQQCHTHMKEQAGGEAPRLVCFNLGYLPWSDKGLQTQPASTTAAIQAALDILAPGGVLSVISYTGHEGGQQEHDAVMALLGGLHTQEWTVCNSCILNRPRAPVLTLAVRAHARA